MARLNRGQLWGWYDRFKKALYEGANIDMDRVEDIGRLKIAYTTKWNIDEPLGTEGELMFACIPHNGLKYDTAPPDIENREEYLNWAYGNLRCPTTIEEIEKLYDMSREGTLMAFLPGNGESGMQQVYTDEFNDIRVSLPMNVTEEKDEAELDPEYRIPEDVGLLVREPIPAHYGLPEGPARPVPPENMEPSFLSFIGWLFGFDTDYKKLKDYEKAAKTYDERFKKWYDRLEEDENRPDRRVAEFKEAKIARDHYVESVEAFWADPIGKAVAICRGFRDYKQNKSFENAKLGDDMFYLQKAEIEFMKKKNSTLPQGQIRKMLDDVNKSISDIDRTKYNVRHLVGSSPMPRALGEWIERGIFTPENYKPKNYDVPKHPNAKNVDSETRSAYTRKMENWAEILGFAALSHPRVSGNPLFEGFNADETAQLQYSMILYNLFTAGRQNCDYYMQFMEPARMEAKAALEAYNGNDLGPIADLLANSIRKTNREAAGLTSIASSDHSINTLYLVNRLWSVLKEEPELLKATGLTPEEIEETKANVALYQTVKKSLDSRKALLEYSLHQRKMTPEQVRQAGADIMLVCQLEDGAKKEHHENSVRNWADPEYQEALEKLQTDPDNAQKKLNLLDLRKPRYENIKDLLKPNWAQNEKAGIIKECNLNRLNEMKREDLGKILSTPYVFQDAIRPKAPRAPKVNVPVNANALQNEAQAQQQVQPQNAL